MTRKSFVYLDGTLFFRCLFFKADYLLEFFKSKNNLN